jgi:CRISPR/Cas system CSM-associated protein Csm3 (group 7 of RAMP superfamily)
MTETNKPRSRAILKRIVVEGDLRLLTPTALGNGDAESLTDMPLLLDTAGDKPLPLLTGASIAGALRNYLRAYEQGFNNPEDKDKKDRLAVELFGAVKGDTGSDENGDTGGEQSRLIVDDALARIPSRAEVRDGVRIDGRTRTAEDKFKYDLELLPAGVIFPLRFELLINTGTDEATLKRALALALHGLETSEIALGGRKTRGFGRCIVEGWRVATYNLRERAELLAWLASDHLTWGYALPPDSICTGTAAKALDAELPENDQRRSFSIIATFALESPMLIRSEEMLESSTSSESQEPKTGIQPDVVHLHNSQNQPVLPGTSLAGVLWARATRIVHTLYPNGAKAPIDLNDLFGRDMHKDKGNPSASRLIVHESEIKGGKTLVQNRVAIDRFTGGALDTALFNEAPQVGGDVELTIAIREPKEPEKGLLLLLLKDLWTSDLPIGGTSAIGRGRLRGLHADIGDEGQTWTMREQDGRIDLPDDARQKFETYVTALNTASGAK